MTSTPPRDWTDIHWPEVSRTAAARWIAVLPLAATEQHGPHLPVGTDVMIAEAYLARVRELLPESIPATFLPLQPVGISIEHIGYPGTLTLPTEVALKTWMALGESVARAGIKKLVMVTSHGGNSAAMTLVAQDLRAQQGLLAVTTGWSRFGAPEGLFSAEELRHGVHGGAVETSIMLAKYPRHVRTEAIADFQPASIAMETDFLWLSTHRPAPFAWQAQDLHPSGAAGDATGASVEKGQLLLDHGATAFCELLADFQPASIAMETDFLWLSTHRPAPFAWQAQDLHPSGAAGDATGASAEKGQLLLDHGATAFCELLADIDRFDPATLSPGPNG